MPPASHPLLRHRYRTPITIRPTTNRRSELDDARPTVVPANLGSEAVASLSCGTASLTLALTLVLMR